MTPRAVWSEGVTYDPLRYSSFKLPYGDGRFYVRKIRPGEPGANTATGKTWVWFVRTRPDGTKAMTFKTWAKAMAFVERRLEERRT